MVFAMKKLIVVIVVTVVIITLYMVMQMDHWERDEISAPTWVPQLPDSIASKSNALHVMFWQGEALNWYSESSVLVLVVSKAKDYDKRMAIRRTWGGAVNNRLDTQLIFVIVKDIHDNEDKEFDDIVVFRYFEDSDSQTMLLIMLNWAIEAYPRADFILKVADDAFLNPFNFQNKLKLYANNGTAVIVSRHGRSLTVESSTYLFSRLAIEILALANDEFDSPSKQDIEELLVKKRENRWNVTLVDDRGFDVTEKPTICKSVINNDTLTFSRIGSTSVTHALWWVLNDRRLKPCNDKWDADKTTINELLSKRY